MAKDNIKPRVYSTRWEATKGWLSEMVGKSETLDSVYTQFTGWMGIGAKITFDYSKVTYSLTRALFYASKVTDRKTGKTYGGKYLYGAIFAKPIVNSTAAFVIGNTPHVETDDTDDAEDEAEGAMNEFMSDNDGKIYKWIRDGMRDGDAYLRINKDLTVDRIAADLVTKIVDPESGALTGYDINWNVKDKTDKTKNYGVREEYRTTAPFYRKLKLSSDGKTSEVLVGPKDGEKNEDDDGSTRLMPIVHIANEQEANEIYGNSDYQNVYLLMASYHEVFESWIKNTIFNNTSMPVIEGVENPGEFMKNNGTKDREGNYRVAWKSDSVMVIGKGGSAKFLNTDVGAAANSEKLIDKLFTLISVASETPEFFLGKEMNASFASVKQQMPVMIKKADRKQKEFTPFMNDLVDVVFDVMQRQGNIKTIPKYKFVWGQIMDDDMEINLKIVDALKKEGIITDRTAAIIAGLGKYVDDIDNEIADARQENVEKNEELFEQTPATLQAAIEKVRQSRNSPEEPDPQTTEMTKRKKKRKAKKE